MKLSKSVGKGCYSTSRSDVLVVQTALANIKRANKPHYCGKLDGKDGPKTEAAIADFQSCNGIKATGKVESYGPTINKLRQKTPMSVKNRISGGIATPAAASNTDMAKVKAVATKTAKQITTKEPLPKVEAAALAKIVMDAAGVGVPLVYKATGISNDGRFVAEFEIASFAQIAHGGSGDHKTKMIQKVSQFVGKYGAWVMGPSGTLKYQTARKFSCLAASRKAKSEHIRSLGLSGRPECPIFARALDSMIANAHKPQVAMQIVGEIRNISIGAHTQNAQSLVKFIDDRNAFEKMAALWFDKDYGKIEGYISAILPRLDKAITALQSPNNSTQTMLKKYFASHTPQTAAIISNNIKNARDFLAVPMKSRFKPAPDAPEEVYRRRVANDRTMGFELSGVIYLFSDRLDLQPISVQENVIIHEALHVFIVERNQRPDKTDPAYSFEPHFLTLATNVALENPDSYVAFINAL